MDSAPDTPIYLDYNATTPINLEVHRAMIPYLMDLFGNPSSGYVYGQRTKKAVSKARRQVAALIGAEPGEIVFTSGGTESDNHAIIGAALANREKGNHIITSVIEHPAVLNTCRYLEEALGFRVTRLPVDRYGLVDPEDVKRAVTGETVLASFMHSNNEVGTLEPIAEIGKITRERGVLFHTDAAQSCGKVPVDVNQLNVDLLTIAGHKLYAPKGIGALYIRRGTRIDPYLHGAGQENGRRAGTENVPFIVGLGIACELAEKALPAYRGHIRSMRDRLYIILQEGLGKDRIHLNGHPKRCLPNTLNVSIRGIIGEELLAAIPEIAASTGSACHAGSTEPSGILIQMGLERDLALGTLRLSLGRATTGEDVERAGKLIVARAKSLIG